MDSDLIDEEDRPRKHRDLIIHYEDDENGMPVKSSHIQIWPYPRVTADLFFEMESDPDRFEVVRKA
jgi:hypothetical protein